jgi:hypothetical protein
LAVYLVRYCDQRPCFGTSKRICSANQGYKVWQRLKAAVDEFLAYRRNTDLADVKGPQAFESDVFAACYVRHFAENRYGFHFKDTDEFGLYGFSSATIAKCMRVFIAQIKISKLKFFSTTFRLRSASELGRRSAYG